MRMLAAYLFLWAATVVQADGSVTLAWDPNPESNIQCYFLYWGTASRHYTAFTNVGNVSSHTVRGLTNGVAYYFALTAVDTSGLESDYSSEVSYTVPWPTNTAPTITLTSPANGAGYTAPATINLAANANANGHTITAVQFYNGATLLGQATAPYNFSWNNVSAGAYSLSALALYDSGSTVGSAAVNVTVAAGPPEFGLTFAADSGTISAPFAATNGTVFQSLTTGATNGGRAAYSFKIVEAGNYLVSAMVLAPSLSQNSLYVNIDAQPTDPLMIWDIPTSAGLTSRTVSWRGNGNGDPALSQYIPKVFALSAGTHQLIIMGREANTTFSTISIVATPSRLRISLASGGTVSLTTTGQPGQTYNVLASQDRVTWTLIGTMTLDATGSGQFTDLAGTSLPSNFYRLQGQ